MGRLYLGSHDSTPGIYQENTETLVDLCKKAYAWTYSNTSSSNGALIQLNYDGTLGNNIACNDITSIKFTDGNAIDGGNNHYTYVLANNQLYTNNLILGNNEYSIKQIITSRNGKQYFIASDGKLYSSNEYLNNSNSPIFTQIGTDTNWVKLNKGNYNVDWMFFALNENGEIYYIYNGGNPVKLDIGNGFEDINGAGAVCYALKEGYIHYISVNYQKEMTHEILTDLNNVSKILYYYDALWVKTSDYKVYKVNRNGATLYVDLEDAEGETKGKLSICKHKLYYNNNGFGGYNMANHGLVNDTINWTDCAGLYAIGDNKLYKVTVGSYNYSTETYNCSISQIGTGTNYVKLFGYQASSDDNAVYAWTGSVVTTTETVYTTKSAKVNDHIYSDTDLTSSQTILSKGNNSITGTFRTYIRDGFNDKVFQQVPTETATESLLISDILHAIKHDNG